MFIISKKKRILQVHVEAINHNVARIYITDANGNHVSVPDEVTLRDSTDAFVPVYNDEFLITWIDSYVLGVTGVDNVWMTKHKQQALKTAAVGVTYISPSSVASTVRFCHNVEFSLRFCGVPKKACFLPMIVEIPP